MLLLILFLLFCLFVLFFFFIVYFFVHFFPFFKDSHIIFITTAEFRYYVVITILGKTLYGTKAVKIDQLSMNI